MKSGITRSIVILLALSMIAVPVLPVKAISGTTLTVQPATSNGVPGGSSFSVGVWIANVTNLVSYDVSLQWDPRILTAVSISDSGTIFQTLPHFTLLLSTGLGFARAAETLLGTGVNVTGSSSQALFFVQLSFIAFGQTPLSITSDTLVDLSLSAIPHTDVNGFASTPPQAQAGLVHWKAKPDIKHLSLSTRGTTNTLFADAMETSGTSPAYVRVIFTVVSATGDVSSAVTPITFLSASQESILSAAWTVPSPIPVKYSVVAQLQVSGDGTLFSNSNSKTFSFTVVA